MSREPSFAGRALRDLVLDNVEFARSGGQIGGALEIASLDRLSDVVTEIDGQLNVALTGWQDNERKSWLRLQVRGELGLVCQRCLERVAYPLEIDRKLQLIGAGEVWPDEDLEGDESDAIEASETFSVAELVEDEVLLALPLAPMHKSCEPPRAADKALEPSPFAVLAALKKH